MKKKNPMPLHQRLAVGAGGVTLGGISWGLGTAAAAAGVITLFPLGLAMGAMVAILVACAPESEEITKDDFKKK